MADDLARVSNGTLSFFAFNVFDSISLNTVNIAFSMSNAVNTQSVSLGLYSMNGSTLSLANSLSNTRTAGAGSSVYLGFTNPSSAQNITPGTWYWGILISTAGNSALDLIGQSVINALNGFPGAFVGGRMTDSTAALPASYATASLDITGNDATMVPYLIISA